MEVILPAEWAPQSRVMLTWPRPDGDFAGQIEAVEACFADIVKHIARFQAVHINVPVNPNAVRRRLQDIGAAVENCELVGVDADDVWCRDHGPITVFREGQSCHLDFTFNGWGGKFPCDRDNRINGQLAQQGALPAPLESVDFVLEGGAIESDGLGTLLTTERCLLATTRNPGMDRSAIESTLKTHLGFDRILWLKHGDLLGDDTDGHIDTLARFCDAHSIAYQDCENPEDAHYAPLAAMAEELRALRQKDGTPYRLVPLPLPEAIFDRDGKRLPAGYANFLIISQAVLVPTYGVEQDPIALATLRPLFPNREVIGVNCRALIEQYGSLHCVTMQLPSDSSNA